MKNKALAILLLIPFALLMIGGVYWLIWQLWLFVVPSLWPNGPENFINPSFALFSAAWFLFVVVILDGAESDPRSTNQAGGIGALRHFERGYVMAMTRAQLRHQSLVDKYKAERAKPPTRMQAKQWLKPIRDAFAQMRTGEVDAIRGYAVTRLHCGDDYARIDYCINGFVGMIERVMPDLNIEPMKSVSKKLGAGVPLVIEDIDTNMAILNACEDRLIKISRQALIDASVTEQINIEIEQLGLKEAA